jgi:hypothetical protein
MDEKKSRLFRSSQDFKHNTMEKQEHYNYILDFKNFKFQGFQIP